MTIYLVQHGKSVPKEEDPTRPLSTIGVQEVEEIAAQLKNYCTKLEVIYHTSKSRAAQTAEILQRHVNATEGTHEIESMNPMDSVQLFARNAIKTDLALYYRNLFKAIFLLLIIIDVLFLTNLDCCSNYYNQRSRNRINISLTVISSPL